MSACPTCKKENCGNHAACARMAVEREQAAQADHEIETITVGMARHLDLLLCKLVFWAHTKEGRDKPQTARMQLDTGADRTILARLPPGARIKNEGCINRKAVYLFDIVAFIPETSCNAVLEAAVPKRRGALPVVIGADFF
jgi:hypothetical protein